jgi:NAD(P)-dependent dehydrogenase (short-subunit alcohol dehydrogenase family)
VKAVLITDAQTPLGRELVRRYRAGGFLVAAAATSTAGEKIPGEPELLSLRWNRASAVSARNILLATTNRFDRLDQVVLLHQPELQRGLLQELPHESIERSVDAWIKGCLFLVKGVLELFARSGGGHLGLLSATAQEQGTAFPPLEAALRGAFHAAAASLFSSNELPSVRINGIESFAVAPREVAEFAFATFARPASRASGRWLRLPQRGLLSARRLLGRSG